MGVPQRWNTPGRNSGASRDGDPAICFCGKEMVSRIGCRAGYLLVSMQALIGCRTVAAAAGAQIDCDTESASGRARHIPPVLGHILLPFPDLVACDTSSRPRPRFFAEPRVSLSNVGRRTMGLFEVEQRCFTPFNLLSVVASGARCRLLHEP